MAVRETHTAALNLTAPPLLRLAAPATGAPSASQGPLTAAQLPQAGGMVREKETGKPGRESNQR